MQLEARNISFRYGKNKDWILKDANFSLKSGERIALTGPSGCGKSTLTSILAGYLEPTEGEILIDGKHLPSKGYSPVQMIHQHPEQAINPRWKMEKVLSECREPDRKLLDDMGIEKEWLNRWPSELSGGELQRFCIARVLGSRSKFLMCDEITTMLDVITQAQIWRMVLKKAEKNDLGLLVVTHNMALADKVCMKKISFDEISGSCRTVL